jgi:hypothetical protein
LDDLNSVSREQLIQIIPDQRRMIEQLRAEVEQLKPRGAAAPFSKGTRKPDPRPPGCKPGKGLFRFRGAPEVKAAEAADVTVALCCCAAFEWKTDRNDLTGIAQQAFACVRRPWWLLRDRRATQSVDVRDRMTFPPPRAQACGAPGRQIRLVYVQSDIGGELPVMA